MEEEYLNPINIFSEIGRLKKVLLHRPGEELENLKPLIMKNFLFDDIPYLKVARQEHEVFVNFIIEFFISILVIIANIYLSF